MISFFPSRTVALSLGSLSVHWYGVMYALAFLVGSLLLRLLLRYRSLNLSSKQQERLCIGVLLGVLLGGRIGYVFLYAPAWFWTQPLEILKVWHGGMSSHGGFIGVAIAVWLFARSTRVPLLALLDVLAVPIAIGLAFGRIGNFINGELYGTLTSLPWGMEFPGVDGLRHPTQLYAVLKDVFLATVCFFFIRRSPQHGVGIGSFLTMYAILRFLLEFLRDQPFGIVHVPGFALSWGQIYTLPLFVFGSCILLSAVRRRQTKTP